MRMRGREGIWGYHQQNRVQTYFSFSRGNGKTREEKNAISVMPFPFLHIDKAKRVWKKIFI